MGRRQKNSLADGYFLLLTQRLGDDRSSTKAGTSTTPPAGSSTCHGATVLTATINLPSNYCTPLSKLVSLRLHQLF